MCLQSEGSGGLKYEPWIGLWSTGLEAYCQDSRARRFQSRSLEATSRDRGARSSMLLLDVEAEGT